MEYPVFEFERKKKRKERRRRIAVVRDNSGPVWHPYAVDYSSRVKTDGGTVEAFDCLNDKIIQLS